jgi:hypothetical protein
LVSLAFPARAFAVTEVYAVVGTSENNLGVLGMDRQGPNLTFQRKGSPDAVPGIAPVWALPNSLSYCANANSVVPDHHHALLVGRIENLTMNSTIIALKRKDCYKWF